MNETDKLIQEQFNRLPQKLQVALKSTPWKSSVKEIALLNKLSPEQTENVERETMFILYGFENPAGYIENMMREVPLDEETATTIAEQVNEKILKIIAAKLEEKKDEPAIITQENKEEALKQLENRADQQKNSIPEIPPQNLPMVEPGQTAHVVEPLKQEKPKPQTSVRQAQGEPPSGPKYPDGKDPYREPLI